jgi:hypothetical protein
MSKQQIIKIDILVLIAALTADEILARQRFASVSAAVATRAKNLSQMGPDKAAFQAQKDEPGGLKTMKKYLWSIELAAYDQAHQG